MDDIFRTELLLSYLNQLINLNNEVSNNDCNVIKSICDTTKEIEKLLIK